MSQTWQQSPARSRDPRDCPHFAGVGCGHGSEGNPPAQPAGGLGEATGVNVVICVTASASAQGRTTPERRLYHGDSCTVRL